MTAKITGTPEPETPAPDITANPTEVNKIDPTVRTQKEAKARVVTTEALLDSGSLAGNFINRNKLTQLRGTHMLRRANDTILVCSGLDNKCLQSNVMLDITLEFDVNHNTYAIDISVRISNDSPLDCILGIDT